MFFNFVEHYVENVFFAVRIAMIQKALILWSATSTVQAGGGKRELINSKTAHLKTRYPIVKQAIVRRGLIHFGHVSALAVELQRTQSQSGGVKRRVVQRTEH